MCSISKQLVFFDVIEFSLRNLAAPNRSLIGIHTSNKRQRFNDRIEENGIASTEDGNFFDEEYIELRTIMESQEKELVSLRTEDTRLQKSIQRLAKEKVAIVDDYEKHLGSPFCCAQDANCLQKLATTMADFAGHGIQHSAENHASSENAFNEETLCSVLSFDLPTWITSVAKFVRIVGTNGNI